MESMRKNMGTNLSSKAMIADIMIIDSIVQTTSMSPFSNPLLDFDSMLKFLILTNMHFANICEVI
jgi:hypothetical protein